MKNEKTWVDYLVIALVVAVVLVGVAALVSAVLFAIAMNSFGSNK